MIQLLLSCHVHSWNQSLQNDAESLQNDAYDSYRMFHKQWSFTNYFVSTYNHNLWFILDESSNFSMFKYRIWFDLLTFHFINWFDFRFLKPYTIFFSLWYQIISQNIGKGYLLWSVYSSLWSINSLLQSINSLLRSVHSLLRMSICCEIIPNHFT